MLSSQVAKHNLADLELDATRRELSDLQHNCVASSQQAHLERELEHKRLEAVRIETEASSARSKDQAESMLIAVEKAESQQHVNMMQKVELAEARVSSQAQAMSGDLISRRALL